MLKKLSFENTQTIIKILALAVVLLTASIVYIANLEHVDLGTRDVGVIAGGVQSAAQVVKSTIQPNQTPVIQSAGLVNTSRISDDNSSANSEAQMALQAASAAIRQGDSESAMSILVSMIAEYPELPEPYANLASLQAGNGKLAEARAILLQGLQTDKAYAALFSNLQKVQGALAANAYTSALTDQAGAITSVTLPMLETIGPLELSEQRDGLGQQPQVENPLSEKAAVELNVTEHQLKTNN